MSGSAMVSDDRNRGAIAGGRRIVPAIGKSTPAGNPDGTGLRRKRALAVQPSVPPAPVAAIAMVAPVAAIVMVAAIAVVAVVASSAPVASVAIAAPIAARALVVASASVVV
jgi:hypothetical protein